MKGIALLFLILGLHGITTAQRMESETYAVYRSALAEIYKQNRETYSNESNFVFLDHTSTDSRMSSSFETEYKHLTDLLMKVNKTSVPLKPLLPARIYHFISQSEFDELMAKGDRLTAESQASNKVNHVSGQYWIPFFTKYPDSSGFYTLSRVAFGNSGTVAMLQITRSTNFSSFSRVEIRRKVRGKWKLHMARSSVSIS